MDLFSDFCNICYKTDDRCLKDTSEENLNNLNDTLITFIGHVDIINDNMINLCQSCFEELTRSNKFREKCFTNLIHLRQSVIDMKSKLELEHGFWAVQNTLKMFVHQEILRRTTFEQRNCPVLIPTEHEKSSGDLSENNSFFNRQIINVQSERNECAFVGDCIDKSVKKSEPQVAFTTVDSAFVKCEKESNEDFGYTEEEFDAINATEPSASEDFESSGHVNPYVEVPAVNNSKGIINSEIEYMTEPLYVKQENSVSEDFESETIGNELGDGQNVPIEFVNACTIVKSEECGAKSITVEENAQEDMNLPSTDCNYKSIPSIMNSQQSRSRVRQQRHGRCATELKSGVHNRVDPAAEPHTCTVCNESFRTKSSLTVHKGTHSGERPYKGTVRNKAHPASISLTVHERLHSGERVYECNVCNKTFRQSGNLNAHKRIHSGDKPYMCTVCNKAFTTISCLNVHERIHSGDKPYECTVCSKAFTTSSSLVVHERVHSGERPYKCTLCKKSFMKSFDLNRHKRTHTGDRPYICTVCNKAFTESGNLIKHERLHSDDRPYKCTMCNKAFKQTSDLTRHTRIHTGNNPFE